MIRPGIIIGAYVILNLLAVYLIDRWLCKSSIRYAGSVAGRVIVCFLYLALAFVPILATIIDDSDMKYFLQRFSYAWLGFLMYFAGILLIATLIAGIFSLIAKARDKKRHEEGKASRADTVKRKMRAKRIYALTFIVIFAGTVALNIYGMIHARDTVIKEYDVSITKEVKSSKDLKIALISDIHLAFNSSEAMIKRMVDKVNNEKPDMIVVTGDLFSSDYYAVANPDNFSAILSELKAKQGVYWVYGNHDVQEPLFCGFALEPIENAKRTKEMVRFIKKCGFTILDDETTAILDGEVQLVGRRDYEKPGDGSQKKRMSANKLMANLDRNKPIIILEHEPMDYENLAKNGADISLSGHTHAGQVFPGTIVTRIMNDMTYGLGERAGMQVLVTSGVGFYGAPLRIGTNSEIAIINMTFR